MRLQIVAWSGAGALLLAACSTPPPKPPPVTAAPASASTAGFLSEADRAAISLKDVLPAPPSLKDGAASKARYEADRKVYRDTRPKDAKDPRYEVALSDDDWKTPAQLKDFSCAAGVSLDAARLPRLVNLLDNITSDSKALGDVAKTSFARQRPFLIDDDKSFGKEPPIRCNTPSTPDYPSGHSTGGWIVGLVLSEILPERTTALFVRARAYADSRVVCGVHNLSATSAGMMSASVVIARLHASEAFRQALAGAQTELQQYIRQGGHDMPKEQCDAEYRLLKKTPY